MKHTVGKVMSRAYSIWYMIAIGSACFSLVSKEKASDCEFAVVIPSYNNENYYKENLDSVCWQNATNPYHIYYINDCSTDQTGTLVEEYVKKNRLEEKVTVIHNDVNRGAGANTYHTIHTYIPDHQIVVIFDGDDILPHNNVLLSLEKAYQDPDIWMTYGVLQTFPVVERSGHEIPDKVFMENAIRKKYWWAGALRTFKSWLFKKIRAEDFYYKGEFMRVSHDIAYLLPMLEMSGPTRTGKNHSKFIEEILYLYRTNTPINDHTLRKKLQMEVSNYIRSLKPYQPLNALSESRTVGRLARYITGKY